MHKTSPYLFASLLVSIAFGTSFSVAYAVQLPGANAIFETSLQSRISSTDTSMTLVSNSAGGESISGYQCFTIDEGRSDAEFVCGTVSGTSVTSLERGLSYTTGTTTISARKFAHRVGANVKQTDYPLLQRLRNIVAGLEQLEGTLSYASHPTFTEDTQLVDKKYVDDTAFSGASVINALTTARGLVELATQIETASSTALGSSGASVVIPASNATSTYNSATAALRVVVTQNNGFIDQGFLPSTTTKSVAFTGTTTLATTTATGISNIASTSIVAFTSSTSPTTTWTKKSNLRYVILEIIGGGGTGGSAGSGGGGANSAGGGGGGGYCYKIIPASALPATVDVQVGGGNTWPSGNGGTSHFGGIATSSGGGGANASAPGGGGGASGCDKNVSGQGGSAATGTSGGGAGGSSGAGMGGGGQGGYLGGGGGGGQYGGGGGGAQTTSGGSSSNGGGGAAGAVFVTEVYF